MSMQSIFREIRRHFTNMPPSAVQAERKKFFPIPGIKMIEEGIENALKDPLFHLVFLIGPFGVGKSTCIERFMHNHHEYKYDRYSFATVNTLNFAFLHLTDFVSRMIFIVMNLFPFFMIARFLPPIQALPIIFIGSYLFIKNIESMIYVLHEVRKTLFSRSTKVLVLDDLERSSLDKSAIWALLANLWQYKRRYLVPLGYSPDDKNGRLYMLEQAMKLGGTIIEIRPNKEVNYALLIDQSPFFPFKQGGEWLSLFTAREILVMREEIYQIREKKMRNFELEAIDLVLEWLFERLKIEVYQKIYYNIETGEFEGPPLDPLSPQQLYYLETFKESVKPRLAEAIPL